jgi:Tfp pilus assembly protein PilE
MQEKLIIAARRTSAFTLLELLGVLAIMTILATVLVASFVRTQDTAARNAELENLETIAGGLKDYIRRSKSIPAHTNSPSVTNWVAAIAAELGWHNNEVSANGRNIARAFIIDPGLQIGMPGVMLPYAQTISGSIQPANARVAILSSISQSLPVNSGVAASAAEFNELWSTADGSAPANWPSHWQGHGNDLIIQRVNLASLFRRLVLNNNDPTAELPPSGIYRIDASPTNQVPNAPGGVDAWFIEGTQIHFHDASGDITTQVLNRDAGFVYEQAKWRGDIFEGLKIDSAQLEIAVALFLDATWNPNNFNVTQQQVVGAMQDYMTTYLAWAAEGFPTTPANTATYVAVQSAQSTLKTATFRLIGN